MSVITYALLSGAVLIQLLKLRLFGCRVLSSLELCHELARELVEDAAAMSVRQPGSRRGAPVAPGTILTREAILTLPWVDSSTGDYDEWCRLILFLQFGIII